MKKRVYPIILVCCIALVTVCKAQTPFQKELSVGFGAGVNFSSVGFVPKVEQGMIMGLHGGATLRWITEKNLGLIAEINYARQGWKEEFPIDQESESPVGYSYSRTLNYIEMPFLTHIYFGSNRARFFINLGPKIGYMISESTSENLHGQFPTEEDPNYGPERVNYQHGMPAEISFDWGLCGGPGVELRTGIGSFLIEGRYYFALGNIYGSSKSDYFSKSNSQVISVKLSYLFTIKKW